VHARGSNNRVWATNRLLEKVIDLEVAADTPSPTVDPSVRTVLIGHSMGGIVAAETVIGITSEKPIYTEDGVEKASSPSFNGLMFPYIQGVLAFDTPYLGISPGVVAHGAEGHYAAATQAWNQISNLGIWGNKATTSNAAVDAAKALPAPPANASTPNAWQKWGRVAMYAGAAGAVAASGAAAYYNRDQLTQGWTWVSSHLEFVGCLAKAEELRKRVQYMVRLNQELNVGFANLYTKLGAGAAPKTVAGTLLGNDRTFCNLPKKEPGGLWQEALNDVANDETMAHMSKCPEYECKTTPANSGIYVRSHV
jgi:hypothetical protein